LHGLMRVTVAAARRSRGDADPIVTSVTDPLGRSGRRAQPESSALYKLVQELMQRTSLCAARGCERRYTGRGMRRTPHNIGSKAGSAVVDTAEPDRKLISGIRNALRAEADPTRAAGAQAYMKSAMPFLGVPAPRVRAITHEHCRARPIDDFDVYCVTVRALFMRAKVREERYAALGIASARVHRAMQTAAALPLYRELIATGAWWDLVDELSVRVGELLARDPEPTAKVLRTWARGEDIWLRRAAIICQRKRKAATDLELLSDCIAPSLGEREFFLQKGIGWALRSVAWHDPAWTVRYVKQHARELSPLSKREALKNLLHDGRVKTIP
jgi:3-methyladenine DNA glycosylase AlkD